MDTIRGPLINECMNKANILLYLSAQNKSVLSSLSSDGSKSRDRYVKETHFIHSYK